MNLKKIAVTGTLVGMLALTALTGCGKKASTTRSGERLSDRLNNVIESNNGDYYSNDNGRTYDNNLDGYNGYFSDGTIDRSYRSNGAWSSVISPTAKPSTRGTVRRSAANGNASSKVNSKATISPSAK
jgi:hypothetical protein